VKRVKRVKRGKAGEAGGGKRVMLVNSVGFCWFMIYVKTNGHIRLIIISIFL